nr:hypothetical protein [Hymenobacter qilianensis]
MQGQPQLNTAYHGFGHQSGQPINQPQYRQQEHDHTNGQPTTKDDVAGQFLGNNEGRKRLQWLHWHGQSVPKSRKKLHQPKHDQHTGAINV